ncbi:DNA translocase FtsK [Anaerobacillus sp. CMMVII]|uniref:DNA translocase FtsK n=1 Tax=Anaerobacillus sp. CMMVII TaxID=2755588 RepID=UPI0021C4CC84|nr:DNA translocase FtsK [Anaerobacillus sp. CMMVII]MCT8137331.1 DNA translocase FtsK [Anaerobacillus sp. CMMVII]
MFKQLKIAYKKVHSFLFGQEIEHLHTRDEVKKYYGRIKTETEAEARMIRQYPKEGKFRFPLIDDDKRSIPPKENKSTKQTNRQQVPIKQSTKQRNVQQKVQDEPPVVPINVQERKKFQGVNFKARNIPSPVYAFGKPPETNHQSPSTLQEEAETVVKELPYNSLEKAATVDLAPINLGSNNESVENFGSDHVLFKEELFHEGIYFETMKVDQEQENEQNVSDLEFFSYSPQGEVETELVEEAEVDIIDTSDDIEPIIEGEHSWEIAPFQEEVAATVEDHAEVPELKVEPEIIEETKQLEQITSKSNTINYETKNVEEVAPRKTVVPFNVLMFQKDRIAQKKLATKEQVKSYQFPTLQLLNIPPRQPDNSNQWLQDKREILELTLANFNVQAKVVGVTKGPAVTRFEIQPEPGVKVSKITGLTDDIKLSLAAKDIRIEAPIPGKNAIGIEVPNDVSDPVVIREILRSSEFQKNPSPLTVALGLDIEGKPIVTDIQKMPHGLIAGATGSGKSVCINSILISIMFKATPDEVKLMLVDPKMVELAPYNDIPHLVTPVITDAKQATVALKWAVEEMERRYELFVQNGVRDIKRYNDVMKPENDSVPAMPYIVIVIDELADLMMVSPQDVEEAICRIAQKARACGIHLLLATQRPSVDVITGLIKANIPSRIAFSVSSQADSRTIIDSGGAERLLGKGDMLLFENGSSKPVRVQGNFVSDEEIDRVIALVKEQRKPNYLFDKEHLIKTYEAVGDQEDDLFEEACYYVLEQGGASSSSLQRKFRIGFNRAARLIDMMEARGIISEAMGSKPRNILISEEELSDRM